MRKCYVINFGWLNIPKRKTKAQFIIALIKKENTLGLSFKCLIQNIIT